jgi:hypothetical protein
LYDQFIKQSVDAADTFPMLLWFHSSIKKEACSFAAASSSPSAYDVFDKACPSNLLETRSTTWFTSHLSFHTSSSAEPVITTTITSHR